MPTGIAQTESFMRLRVSPLSSIMQLSHRQAGLTEHGQSHDAGGFGTPWQIQGGRLREDSRTIQAPPLCSCPLPIFGA